MSYFEEFTSAIKLSKISISDNFFPQDFLISSSGEISIYYAPFDYVNPNARIMICGITPGFQQAVLAINEAKSQLLKNSNLDDVKKLSKETASFGGAMRNNLISMLDNIGLPRKLGIVSCEMLFTSHTHLVHYTSALRYPVFVNGKNYNGTPNMISNKFLRGYVEKYLVEEIDVLPKNCIFVPLGPKVTEVFTHLSAQGVIDSRQVLDGLPHPSGANAERISYFLGRKKKEDLSKKTNSFQIDIFKERLLKKVQMIEL